MSVPVQLFLFAKMSGKDEMFLRSGESGGRRKFPMGRGIRRERKLPMSRGSRREKKLSEDVSKSGRRRGHPAVETNLARRWMEPKICRKGD